MFANGGQPVASTRNTSISVRETTPVQVKNVASRPAHAGASPGVASVTVPAVVAATARRAVMVAATRTSWKANAPLTAIRPA